MRQNIANFMYSNFLGRTSQKKHPVVADRVNQLWHSCQALQEDGGASEVVHIGSLDIPLLSHLNTRN